MIGSFPKIQLTEYQEKWMRTIFEKTIKNEPINERILRTELWGIIPNDFEPKSIDKRLLIGFEISLFGILHLDENTKYVEITDKIANHIRDTLLGNLKLKEISAEEISKDLGYSVQDVSLCLKFLGGMGHFWSSASFNDYGYSRISIEDEHFNNFIRYPGIAELLDNFFIKYDPAKPSDFRSVFASLNKISQYEPPEDIYREKSEPSQYIFKPIFKSKIDQIDKRLCFVLMPFTQEWSTRVYNELIRPNVEKLGVQCLRADNLTGSIIIEDIWTKINQSAFVIADVTSKNANVMYELGLVHTIGKPSILMTQEINNIPFDFNYLRHHEYKDNVEGFRLFGEKLPQIIIDIYHEYYEDEINFI